MRKFKKSIILTALIFLGVLSFGFFISKNDFKTSCLIGAVLALAYLAFVLFMTSEAHESKKEKEKEEIIHDITYDDFNQEIDKILNEEAEDSNSSPYQNFLEASILLGFAATALTEFNSIENFDSSRFWLRVFIIGAALTAGIRLALKYSRIKEFENLKKITIATYFKLKRVQDEYRSITKKDFFDKNDEKKNDELLYEAAKWAIEVDGISIAAIQKHFQIGYYKAGKIIDQMYSLGICGPSTGDSKPRIMLIDMDGLEKLKEKITQKN